VHTQDITSGMATIGGAGLYYEVRGSGPTVLLAAGIPGDAGQFETVAGLLAADHQVVTYDRRGNSRSPRPVGWSATSVDEQVADVAGLLEFLGTGPVVVYGTSNGAILALELALSRPELVRGLMLHEMPLLSVLADPEAVGVAMGGILEPAFAAGGPDAALQAFLRFAFGDAVVDSIEPDMRERMLANGEVAMTIELPATQPYRPEAAALAQLGTPVQILVGSEQQVPFFHEAAAWLAEQFGVDVLPAPGGHGPQFDHAPALANCIARFAGVAA
jgi:pimeloyl-ACP methyl ester carboxylesterase